MSWSIGFICPDCDLAFIVEDETPEEFLERHLETCLVEEHEGD